MSVANERHASTWYTATTLIQLSQLVKSGSLNLPVSKGACALARCVLQVSGHAQRNTKLDPAMGCVSHAYLIAIIEKTIP